MSDAQWRLRIHQGAERELAGVTGEVADMLTDRLRELQRKPDPTEPAYCKPLSETDLWRVRADQHRAIWYHDPPEILVLLVGH